MADEKGIDEVEMKGRSPRVGGQPWWKLAILQPTHITERLRSKMHYILRSPRNTIPKFDER